jgi:hypothetical protein
VGGIGRRGIFYKEFRCYAGESPNICSLFTQMTVNNYTDDPYEMNMSISSDLERF